MHHVGAADPELVDGAEVNNSRVFEEPAEDRPDNDVLGVPAPCGRSAQMPRTTTSTRTPAWDARYSASITCSSTNALAFSRIRPSAPSAVAAISRSMRSMMPLRTPYGATTAEGAEGRIRLKANALVDEQVIDALYRASQAGVRVEVVVRGICALRPHGAGYSENIVVRSILGRFLEHSRIIHFGAIDEFWIGSADMMHRNLDRRVEVMAQVKDPRLTAQLNDGFESAMDPATRCWELGVDGHWTALPHEGQTVRDHQVSLMERRRHP